MLLPGPWTLPECSRSSRANNLTVLSLISGGNPCQAGLWLNYHRPCAQADIEVDEKGRQQRHYRRYQTPLEALLALSRPTPALRQGLTVAVLQRIAAAVSDTEAAQRMQKAKAKLFERLRQPADGPWK